MKKINNKKMRKEFEDIRDRLHKITKEAHAKFNDKYLPIIMEIDKYLQDELLKLDFSEDYSRAIAHLLSMVLVDAVGCNMIQEKGEEAFGMLVEIEFSKKFKRKILQLGQAKELASMLEQIGYTREDDDNPLIV